jgi:hypothetical protein
MAHPRMVDAFVRELLDEAFGADVEVQGRRYILPLPARPVVEVVPGEGHALRVQVAAPVATEVAAYRDLLGELNEVNGNLPYGRVFLVDGRVWAEHTVLGAYVDGDELDNAIRFVCWVVRVHGEQLAAAGHGRPAAPAPRDGGTDRGRPGPGQAAGNGAAGVGAEATQLVLTPAGGELLHDTPAAANAAGYL